MSGLRLEGKKLLVTGSSKGIGAGCILAAAKDGADCAINYRGDKESAEKVADEVRSLGRKAVVLQADASDQAQVEELVAKAAEGLGGLNAFVSNAAFSDREPFLDADMAGVKKTIDISMWGAFYALRAAGRHMRDNGGGTCVVISSPHAEIAFPTAIAYNMAKAAIDHMARTAAVECYKYGIRINICHPGWIDTPGERKFFTEEQLKEGGESLLVGRLGQPSEVGDAVVYLLSEESRYMIGSTLTIDGGVKLPFWSKREEGGQ
ncbi:SDR family NAD(P)-dependent oxidoreductase [Stratiformator vulcanicus]|uniref:Glucose 1-dehydrogenase 2 n=1 Tax=Stratiformator vulcanicus TaxID=2527980 RepID=A0A517R7Z2_9PLAN|nr:SDR family oxidoreductase [Stratiformator vulcanicus]QDT39941.1 Glucose 1-dehydrogenase 2 [Stratiformator vulcanicus]